MGVLLDLTRRLWNLRPYYTIYTDPELCEGEYNKIQFSFPPDPTPVPSLKNFDGYSIFFTQLKPHTLDDAILFKVNNDDVPYTKEGVLPLNLICEEFNVYIDDAISRKDFVVELYIPHQIGILRARDEDYNIFSRRLDAQDILAVWINPSDIKTISFESFGSPLIYFGVVNWNFKPENQIRDISLARKIKENAHM